MSEWLDLENLISEMFGSESAVEKDLAVLGGDFPAGDLDGFLAHWALPREKMPWAIWQWTDEIRLAHMAQAPGGGEYLERGRLFGPDGDLELRRVGDEFHWRYVGLAPAPDMDGFAVDLYPFGVPLRKRVRTALLWGSQKAAAGQKKTGWHEDRVAWAKLDYHPLTADRVQLRYVEYLYGSQVMFVRLADVENHPGGQDG